MVLKKIVSSDHATLIVSFVEIVLLIQRVFVMNHMMESNLGVVTGCATGVRISFRAYTVSVHVDWLTCRSTGGKEHSQK